MRFLRQCAKALLLIAVTATGLVLSGADPESAKFQVINALVFFAALFIFLYGYLEIIGLLETIPYRGFAENDAPPFIWKFLGGTCSVIALVCWVVW